MLLYCCAVYVTFNTRYWIKLFEVTATALFRCTSTFVNFLNYYFCHVLIILFIMRFLHEPSQGRILGATLSHAMFYLEKCVSIEFITMTLLWTLEISIRKKKKKRNKLLCKKSNLARVSTFSSLRTTLTEEDMASCSRAFRQPKNAEEGRKLIENGPLKSTSAVKK